MIALLLFKYSLLRDRRRLFLGEDLRHEVFELIANALDLLGSHRRSTLVRDHLDNFFKLSPFTAPRHRPIQRRSRSSSHRRQ